MLEIAKQYHKAGLTVVPFNAEKKCLVSWKQYQTKQPTIEEIEKMFSQPGIEYIALICGSGIEAIDIDAKNNLEGQDIAKDYGEHLKFFTEGEAVLKKLLIESTRNNGFHFIYKCEQVGNNDKLAYNANNEVIIETRGEGGLLFIAPSVGYQVKRGSFFDIPKITVDERMLLFNVARSFNSRDVKETESKEEIKSRSEIRTGDVVWSWDDYNGKDDCLQVLKNAGWVELTRQSNSSWLYFNRPGAKNKSNVDAAYNLKEKYFYVFTASDHIFEDSKGYSPTAIYAKLKCNGDFKQASRELFKTGYGTHDLGNIQEEKEKQKTAKDIAHHNKILSFVESTRFDRTAKIIEEEACLFVTTEDHKFKVGGFGMLGCIVGAQKSGKSLVSTCIAGSAISGGQEKLKFSLEMDGKELQFYDTEQSFYFYQVTQNRIYDIAMQPDNVPFYSAYHLRRLSKKDRLEAIRHFIYESENLGVVIIDGVVDLLNDYNDLRESQQVVDSLMRWADEKNCLIITILHLNKSAGAMRGHLGTELQNKCDFAIEIKNDKDLGSYTVSSRESRFRPFPRFDFTRDKDGMPILDEQRVDGQPMPEQVVVHPFEPEDEEVVRETREAVLLEADAMKNARPDLEQTEIPF